MIEESFGIATIGELPNGDSGYNDTADNKK
jgi:hypothetical protein